MMGDRRIVSTYAIQQKVCVVATLPGQVQVEVGGLELSLDRLKVEDGVARRDRNGNLDLLTFARLNSGSRQGQKKRGSHGDEDDDMW